MLEVNINFDATERAWRTNKIYLGNGVFQYKKQKKTKNNLFPCPSPSPQHGYNLRCKKNNKATIQPHGTRGHCYNLRNLD